MLIYKNINLKATQVDLWRDDFATKQPDTYARPHKELLYYATHDGKSES